MKKLSFSALFFILFTLFLTSCSTTTIQEEESLYSVQTTSKLEMEILDLVNEYRASLGLNALTFNPTVYDYATEHTTAMISEGMINHTDFDVRSSNLAVETNGKYVSENVGRNFKTANGIVQAWIKSDTHRKIMEGDYNYTAVSAKQDQNGVFYFTQLFLK